MADLVNVDEMERLRLDVPDGSFAQEVLAPKDGIRSSDYRLMGHGIDREQANGLE